MRLVFPLVLLLSPLVPAQGLDEALAAADELAASGNYGPARQALIEDLAAAPDRGPVLARIGEIQQRLADWAFYERVSNPGPEDLLSGTVKSWKDKGLKFKLIYDWEELSPAARSDDFFAAEDQWFFRIPLTKDLKFKLEGDWPADPANFALLAGFDEHGVSGWRFTPGFRRTKIKPIVTLPQRAERIGRPFEVFHTTTEDLDEPAGSWAYSIELRKGTFTFKRGNKKIGAWKTKYPDQTDGYLGFSGVGIKRLEFSGQLDPDAWANRSLELLERKRERFLREEYDIAPDMPDWYRELKAASDAAPPMRAPDGVPQAVAKDWDQLSDPDAAIELEKWANMRGGLEAGPAAYVSALRYRLFGEWQACDAQLKIARQEGLGEFGPVLALEAMARFHLGARQKSIEELRPHLEAWPDDVGYTLARLNGRVFGPRKMLESFDEAVAAGGLSESIADSRRVLQTALAFAREDGVTRFSGSVVHLFSDGDPDFAQDLGRGAVAAIGFMSRYWSQVRQAREPLMVLHFRSQDHRRAFCQDAGLPADAEGYLPPYRLSLVVLDPERADVVQPRPLFTALWQQYLDSTLDVEHAPRWFVHGFGGVMGGCVVAGSGVDLRVNLDLILDSSENDAGWFFSPTQLANLPHGEWDKHRHWAVCESYLLLRYLWSHAPRKEQDMFRAYANALFEGKTRGEAWKMLFGTIDLNALVSALAAYRQGEIDNL